jgi:Rieske Fe-S protein
LGAAASAAAGIPILGYLLAPALKRQRDQWIDLGPVDQFVEGETRLVDAPNPLRRPWDGDSGKMSAYVRRVDASSFLVMAINCTHLGCPVAWFPEAGLFMCPCHGGVYYEDGARASGPPPRGLYQYRYQIVDGRLQILGGHFPTLHDTFRDDESTTA